MRKAPPSKLACEIVPSRENFFIKSKIGYAADGEKTELDEIMGIWRIKNYNNSYLTSVYSDDNAGQNLSEYAICITVPKYMNISVNYPV